MNRLASRLSAIGRAPARAWRSASLRRKLPLLIVLLLTSILTLSLAVTYRVLTREAEATAVERLEHALAEVRASAEAALAARTERVTAVATDVAVRRALLSDVARFDPSEHAAAVAALAGLRDAGRTVELWRADGRRVLSLGSPSTPATAPRFHDSDDVVHGTLFEEEQRARAWTVTPVSDGGRRIGYVASQLQVGGPEEAARTISGLTGEAVLIHVRNADGSVWMRHPGTVVDPPQPRSIGGRAAWAWPDIGDALAVEAAIGGTPWLLTLATPLEYVHAQPHATIVRLAAASALLMALGALLAWLLSRHITRPLAAVTTAATAISRGDYTARIAHSGADEVGRLAEAFNRMVRELETSHTELLGRVRDAQLAREEAEQANRAKSDFLAVMSHELRTPLNAIGGYTQLLEMGIHGELNARQLDALRRVEANQAHLLALVDDVLSYARLKAGKVEFAVDDVALEPLLGELAPYVEPQLAGAGIAFHEELVNPALTVRADAHKLQQILLNLITNAGKYTPRGGSVCVACDVGDGVVRISVRDTGIGIAPDRLEAIFDPFYQTGRTLNRPLDGVGLGLAISRDLARGMGGDIAVSSEPGAGSTFTILLPRGADRVPEPAAQTVRV
jgi:signal transduction histidine kinase